MTLDPRIVELLREQGADDVLVTVEETIPNHDIAELEEAGRGGGLHARRVDRRHRRVHARRGRLALSAGRRITNCACRSRQSRAGLLIPFAVPQVTNGFQRSGVLMMLTTASYHARGRVGNVRRRVDPRRRAHGDEPRHGRERPAAERLLALRSGSGSRRAALRPARPPGSRRRCSTRASSASPWRAQPRRSRVAAGGRTGADRGLEVAGGRLGSTRSSARRPPRCASGHVGAGTGLAVPHRPHSDAPPSAAPAARRDRRRSARVLADAGQVDTAM